MGETFSRRRQKRMSLVVTASEAWRSQGFSFAQLPDPPTSTSPGFTLGTREPADTGDRLYLVPSRSLRGPSALQGSRGAEF